MKSNRKRILSIYLVLVLTISGLIAITPASIAESEKDVSKIEIESVSWDITNQGFVVALSLNFGLATAGEHADFLVAATLNFDADGNSVILSGESAIVKAEGAKKDSDNMITIDPRFIPWDRNSGTFEGLVQGTILFEIFNPGKIGTYHVMVQAYKAFEDAVLAITTLPGNCPDEDGDGVCDADDVCPGFDDTVDSDGDGIPDGCDDDQTPPPIGEQ